MAPKAAAKGAKRAAQKDGAKAAPEPKKSKTAEQKPKMDPLVKVICDAVMGADLPPSCREMLVACAPQAFSSYASERLEIQQAVVRMCGDVVESARLKLLEQFDEADAKVLELEGGKDGLLTQSSEAARRREDAARVASTCAAALTDASLAKAGATQHLAAVQEAQCLGDAGLVEATAHLATMRTAIESDLPALAVDTEAEHSPAPLAALEPLLALLDLDESLVSAVRAACAKKSSERGPFDKIAIEQLEKSTDAKAQDVSAKVQELTPASQERAAATAAAADAAAVETEREGVAAQAAEASRKALECAEAGVEAARQAEDGYEPSLEAAKKVREQRDAELQSFCTNQVSSFETLRDKQKPQPPTAAPAEPSPPEAEGAVEAKALVEEAASPAPVVVGGA